MQNSFQPPLTTLCDGWYRLLMNMTRALYLYLPFWLF